MIQENIKELKNTLTENITLVAVSKTKPNSDILEAYNSGHRVFGENKIQEMVEKYDALPKDIKWHMIGHLQRNKVKYMAHFVDLIHGVDKLKTLKEINKQAAKHNRVIKCLLQAKIAEEDSKFGLDFTTIQDILNSQELKEMKNVSIVGLMGMATFTNDTKQINKEFKSLSTFYNQLKLQQPSFTTISMGMSGDYKIAIENGSNMIRVGSAIFGKRNYNN